MSEGKMHGRLGRKHRYLNMYTAITKLCNQNLSTSDNNSI